MTLFQVKALLAVLLTAAGLTAAFSMLTLMGTTERRIGAKALRNTHHAAGYTFSALLAVLAVMGLRYLSAAGDTLPVRGVLHWTLASLLVFLLLLKLLIVRFFKQFLRYVPVLGMAVITLALVVVTLSAVFFAVTGAGPDERPARTVSGEPDAFPYVAPADASPQADEAAAGAAAADTVRGGAGRAETPASDAAGGRAAFGTYCSGCHYADSREKKIGPGLAGLFGRDALPVGGGPVTQESVLGQLDSPVGTMPSFRGFLSDEQARDLIAYLETL